MACYEGRTLETMIRCINCAAGVCIASGRSTKSPVRIESVCGPERRDSARARVCSRRYSRRGPFGLRRTADVADAAIRGSSSRSSTPRVTSLLLALISPCYTLPPLGPEQSGRILCTSRAEDSEVYLADSEQWKYNNLWRNIIWNVFLKLRIKNLHKTIQWENNVYC